MKKFIILILAVLVLSVSAQAADWQMYEQYTVTTNYAGTYNITNELNITEDSVERLKMVPDVVGVAPPSYTGNYVVTYSAVLRGVAYPIKATTNAGSAFWIDTIDYQFPFDTGDVFRITISPAPGVNGAAASNTVLSVGYAQP